MNRKWLWAIFLLLLFFVPVSPGSAAPYIVENGRPRAEIVIAPDAPRMAKLAAEELRDHLERITGASLPVVTTSGSMPVQIYVGRSAGTNRLGLSTAGLDHGAFRIVSRVSGFAHGENWLALLGRDDDFKPGEPYTMSSGADDPDRARVFAAWDKLSGGTYGNPRAIMSRRYSRAMNLWAYDRRGSLNAVYEFLRGLGVRWYMPGDLGTIIPRLDSIPLTGGDRTVRPDFTWREGTFATFFSSPPEDILWYLRQGFNSNDEVGHNSHGLRDAIARPEMKEAHPEYYALVRGVRQTERAHACLSAEGLVREAAQFARALFDVYDLPMVSMMPQDGFTFCQCDLCRGKDTPGRGREGMHSDYVWGFVDRVAREVRKTHPDKKINCLAYGTYLLPPEKIERLSPNIAVGIVHSRGREFDDPEARAEILALRRAWREKTDQPFWSWEHYPFTNRSTITPLYYPRAIAEGIHSMRGEYFGEFIEIATGPFEVRGHGLHEPGFNHLNVYVTGRFHWDANQDLDALLAEYYRLFYGPAAGPMQAFIEYSETNRLELEQNTGKIDTALAMFDAAAARVKPDSEYGRRIALLGEYLVKLRAWRDQLARGRENVPAAEAPPRAGVELALDGRLDEAVWAGLTAYPLVDVVTGGEPRVGSWFKVYWEGGERAGHLVVGIHCDEPDMANLLVPTADAGDWRLYDGDNVEVILETQAHSYYQLTINAAGALVDLDRHLGGRNDDWSSLAQAAGYRGADFWSVEARIPVTGEDVPGDPLHELAGRRPSAAAPWHIQVGRQRLRGPEREWTAWSPTGSNFHKIMRFGRLTGPDAAQSTGR